MRDRGPAAPARDRARPPEERSLNDSGPKFLGSFPRADVVLDPPLPEVAFLGRSNVGKSSLLNALVGQRIARVSATPGKTRMLNVFLIPATKAWGRGDVGRDGAPRPHAPTSQGLYLLDLPGYGYARASHTDRAAFRELLRGIVDRPGLAGVVWLLDIRREPSADDGAMREGFAAAGTKVLAALTKGDKLPRGQRLKRVAELAAKVELPAEQVVSTSAQTGDGIGELRDAIVGLIRDMTP